MSRELDSLLDVQFLNLPSVSPIIRLLANQGAPYSFGQGGLFLRRHIEHPVLGHHGVELLPLVWHAGRQRRDVPVDVGIALVAAEWETLEHFPITLNWEML